MIRFTLNGRNYDFRNPTFGNTDGLAFQRINGRTRGGDLILFRDAEWPKTETLGLTFDFPDEPDYRRFLNFIRASFGIEITYRDHENRTWTGFIQNPDVEGTQTGPATFQVQIVFEGDLI